jgi:hypothetical protein
VVNAVGSNWQLDAWKKKPFGIILVKPEKKEWQPGVQ